LKARYRSSLQGVLDRPNAALAAAGAAVLVAAAAVPFFPTTFLPPFNEGTLLIGLRLNPGVTLSESSALARQAEVLVKQVPEVTHVGRRSGRAELDEHAEGVHVSELDVGLKPTAELTRSMDEIKADIRKRLVNLPAALEIGQPISHRIDHMLSGVRSQIAIKIFGDDLDALRGQADALRAGWPRSRGLPTCEIEKQVLAPQIKVRIDYAARRTVRRAGAADAAAALQTLVEGEKVTQIVEGSRRFALVVRCPNRRAPSKGSPDPDRDAERPRPVVEASPPSRTATGRTRSAATTASGASCCRPMRRAARSRTIVGRHPRVVAETKLPEGYFITLDGQFQAQEEASRLVGLLSIVSLDADVRRALQPLQVGGILGADHGQHPARAGRRSDRPVALGPAAERRSADRLHHARRHLGAQRHPEGQPLHQPDALRGREPSTRR
jgi:HME family heavy-metal exporter